jgi:small-conductance mechanosensitive channel
MSGWSMVSEFFQSGGILAVLRAVLLVGLGWILARIARRTTAKLLEDYLDRHASLLAQRIVFYGVLMLFFATALREMGFELGLLLGAAGVLTIALGFASQTSASNLISGLFLLAERPFEVGDTIRVGSTTGEVLSIDLLSVKLRTFDNLYVRIPNELMIKSEFATLTRFPIRRIDLQIGVAYKESIEKVRDTLLEVADRVPICLEEPKPLFIVTGFGDSSIDLQLSVWAQRENFLLLKNEIQQQIKSAFDAAGIEIPFPHRTIYAGSVTAPLPIRVVGDSGRPDPGSSTQRAVP